ncbi:MAG TPA: hypothetical protein VLM91_06915, partial [Candidatus Methylomirabilis sp.]|nr:hypothetical protein [Candidatus Methylomirabilis sp.]
MTQKAFRITYATMSADNEALHAAYEKGIQTAKSWLGQKHPFYVNGEARQSEDYVEERSPIDTDIVIGYFARAGVRDVNDAVASAKTFSAEWSRMP